jgi:hypothetical protein
LTVGIDIIYTRLEEVSQDAHALLKGYVKMAEETSSQAQPEQAQAPSRVEYVEELAGPDDYWLSITSAARVVRRQDITIRRWIASGMLPMRGDPAKAGQPGAPRPSGLNKRTRYVRASDLEKLSPIVDPSAVIIGEEGRLDLPSIPVEQAAIKNAHQQLLGEVADLRQQVQTHTQTFQAALAEQAAAWQRDLEAFRTSITMQITEMERVAETQAGQLTSLGDLITDHQGQIERMEEVQRQQHESLTGRIDDSQRQVDQLRKELTGQREHFAATLQAYQQEIQRSRQDWEQAMALQNKTLDDLQHAIERVEYREEELARQQQEASRTATKCLEQLEERLGQIATVAQAAQSSAQGYQKRAAAQDRQIEELRRLFQQEVEARLALARQQATRSPGTSVSDERQRSKDRQEH